MPQGAYYVMADISAFAAVDDVSFAHHLVREVGVATVPGSSFFHEKELGRHLIRFCFCKRDETLDEAIKRLKSLRVIV
jgi:aminotransferase